MCAMRYLAFGIGTNPQRRSTLIPNPCRPGRSTATALRSFQGKEDIMNTLFVVIVLAFVFTVLAVVVLGLHERSQRRHTPRFN